MTVSRVDNLTTILNMTSYALGASSLEVHGNKDFKATLSPPDSCELITIISNNGPWYTRLTNIFLVRMEWSIKLLITDGVLYSGIPLNATVVTATTEEKSTAI